GCDDPPLPYQAPPALRPADLRQVRPAEIGVDVRVTQRPVLLLLLPAVARLRLALDRHGQAPPALGQIARQPVRLGRRCAVVGALAAPEGKTPPRSHHAASAGSPPPAAGSRPRPR